MTTSDAGSAACSFSVCARREGVRRFSALAQADNTRVVGLVQGLGATGHVRDGAEVHLMIDLPKRCRIVWMLPGLGGCVWYGIDVSVG
jgi:hypothetical protein